MSDGITFDICGFPSVWDTEPLREVVTLPELTHALRRFAVKPKIKKKIIGEARRIDKAWSAWQGGSKGAGPAWRKLKKAEEEAAREGHEAGAFVRARYEKLKADAHRNAKKELRLWSPTLYKVGTNKRGSDNVAHLSCLVLDFDDDNACIEEASDVWASYFHIVHTTWSHSLASPRFRLVLPLSNPVRAEDWPDVWCWAEGRTGTVIDPSCKGIARAYALPTIPQKDAPRRAFCHGGALLDPVLEGIVAEVSPLTLGPYTPPEVTFVGGQPDVYYVEHIEPDPAEGPETDVGDSDFPDPGFLELSEEDLEDASAWDGLGHSEPAQPTRARKEPASSTKPVGDGGTASSQSLPNAAARRLEHLEHLLAQVVERLNCLADFESSRATRNLVEALDRLVELHKAGLLTDEEFKTSKSKLLGSG